MLIDYLSCLENVAASSKNFKDAVKKTYFSNSAVPEDYCRSSRYLELLHPLEACVRTCDEITLKSWPSYRDPLKTALADLVNPKSVKTLEQFESRVNAVIDGFLKLYPEIKEFCTAFDADEKVRFNEALHNLLEQCSYSCILMSIGAVESRLMKLMKVVRPDLSEEIDRFTPGRVLMEYNNQVKEYHNIVLPQYESLLKIGQKYRLLSVNADKDNLTQPIARSVFHLTMTFLTNPEMQPREIEKRYKGVA